MALSEFIYLLVLDMVHTRRSVRRPVGPINGSTNHPQMPQTDDSSIQPSHATTSPIQPQLPSPTTCPIQPQLPSAAMGPSHSQPQDPHQLVGSVEEASSDSTSAKKRTRGPTRCLGVWKMREGQRIRIPINIVGQPVGDYVPKLTNFLGTIARNVEYASLTFSDWRALPKEKKDDMWGLVISKFEFETDARPWVMKSLAKKWRDWKSDLKKLHYTPHQTDEARLADLDERVHLDQWKALIEFWNSEEGNACNKTNTVNRRKQQMGHVAGSKSFARIREEEKKKRASGKDLSRVDMFILTHTCKDGRPVDEASSIVMAQLNERSSQQPNASQNSTARNDIFSEVMGEDRHGRIRTYGLGPSPSDLWGTTPNRFESQRMASTTQRRDEQYEGLQAEMSLLKERDVIRQAEISSLKETVATLLSAITNTNINLATVLGASANPNLNQPSSSSSRLHSTPQRNSVNKGKSMIYSSNRDVTEVLLTSFISAGVTVAKGVVLSKDPLTKVGGFELGTGFWEVSIQVAMMRQEALVRPHGRYKTIGDVIGTTIAWPACLCTVVSKDG